ncbi:hypothetical protein [Thalassoroseus pseudoceratinae]|uniref:hypothetical protein n=1 Tax=Thalassoroseus pseudoceratinae TaxID=2713176 RepID=UPI0014239E40|nr:hypothetical protein [Thalassoroseus pseudoceratinae]
MTKQYLKWYAVWDLNSPASLPVTRVVRTSIQLATVLTVVSATFAMALPQIEELRLDSRPFAKSLWVGTPQVRSRLITPDRLDRLNQELALRIEEGKYRVTPFHGFELRFAEHEPPGMRTQFGCVMKPGSMLQERFSPSFAETPGSGLIVTARLLEELGYSLDDPPETLKAEFGDNGRPQVSLPIQLIIDEEPHYNVRFFIPHAEYERIFEEGHFPMIGRQRVGPIDDRFPTAAEINADSIIPEQIERVKVEEQAKSYILISDPPRIPRKWDAIIGRLRHELRMFPDFDFPEDEPILPDVEPFEITQESPVFNEGYDLAEIRVDSLSDLQAAAEACEAAGYPADETLVKQLLALRENGLVARIVVAIVVFLLAINAAYITWGIQQLRSRIKRPEVGMLKAMGVSHEMFRSMLWTQTFYLIRVAVGVGILVAVVPLIGLGALLVQQWEEWRTLAEWFGILGLGIGLLMSSLIGLSLFRAGRADRDKDATAVLNLS